MTKFRQNWGSSAGKLRNPKEMQPYTPTSSHTALQGTERPPRRFTEWNEDHSQTQAFIPMNIRSKGATWASHALEAVSGQETAQLAEPRRSGRENR